MKKVLSFFFAVICIFKSIFLLNAQNTEGKDFWVTFGNIATMTMMPGNISLFEMQIRIVCGSTATSGTISFTDLGTEHHFNVNPYEIYNYVLDDDEKYAVYNSISDNVTNYSIHITTLQSVSVYAYNRYAFNYNDVTNILPVTALGTEYYAISYKPATTATNDAYGVVATQNNTHLWHNGSLAATLNAGQVYYRTSGNPNGVTGDFITSDKPIAVFVLCKLTAVPSGMADILFQQLSPVNTWGKTFFVPTTIIGIERVRIVVSKNNTTITQKGAVLLPELEANRL